MRLTHLKLAGFKSFVDPTTLHIHGQRVGVVGPNGCGKSNVMESVRWVLGESSAKEMRADAMDAVIFNGSSNRKPISRASVELVFDNSLGSAAGEWSQYAEISVKRVIERDKGSIYYINNSVVRRRDVADLFLGTGLGGRAYAIIGQNTISRIVEAKPEDMRIFLEEAAGISKYKERRRETEMRLRDTRENLTRVEDILRELDKQINRLQSQALVASEFKTLQSTLNIVRGQVWLVKKRHASMHWEKTQRNVEALVNALEAQMAALRHSESALETARQANFTANEAVNVAQAQYYEANAEVSNLENQVRNTAEARERMQLQLNQTTAQLEKNTQSITQTTLDAKSANEALLIATQAAAKAEHDLKIASDAVPALTEAFHDVLNAFNQSQLILQKAQESARLEDANIGHLQRAINDTAMQIARLKETYAEIDVTPDNEVTALTENLTDFNRHIATLETELESLNQVELEVNEKLRALKAELSQATQALNVAEAEIGSLTKLQAAIQASNNPSQLQSWLQSHGFAHAKTFWQLTKVEAGWETALEAMLGHKLNAIMVDDLSQAKLESLQLDRPASLLTLANLTDMSIAPLQIDKKAVNHQYARLLDKIAVSQSGNAAHHEKYSRVLSAWLAGVYVIDLEDNIAKAAQALADSECLINQHGDIYTRHSVSYYAAQSDLHGVLERQTQLDTLLLELPNLQSAVQMLTLQSSALENTAQESKKIQSEKNLLLKALTANAHQLNLSIQQKQQTHQNNLTRQKTVQSEIDNFGVRLDQLQKEHAAKLTQVNNLNEALPNLKDANIDIDHRKQVAQQALNAARNQVQTIERDLQEKRFNLKLNTNKYNDLSTSLEALHAENKSLTLRSQETSHTLNATQMETLKQNLEKALTHKQVQEQLLATARNQMAESETTLLQYERERMQQEQALHPQRDALEASRLSEQEARLSFEQCQSALAACDMSENDLSTHLANLESERPDTPIKLSELERKSQQVENQIASLGNVNLAAIDELNAETTRKQYLDSQSCDLKEASETLEDAIRKIDRETRGRLQTTFDEANRHFNELFTTLFGGGQARLELLGEEILDTGMQVFAQPPGKKNSTIHLLSGGEKALTALALVFALFRLNPAPFCLMDEVDAPLDDSNTERFCALVKKMSEKTQFLYVSHNKITMEMAQQLIGVTMQESGVSRIVDVDMEAAIRLTETAMA